MSRRRRDPDELDDPDDPDEPLEDEDVPLDDDVEYLLVDPDDDCWRTSVPKSLQSLQTSISAPSTFTVVIEDTSFPHISHCDIPLRYDPAL